ncbi:MAG: AAA family ATPase [Sandaracinus sp.]|nr:AAA family ATPase [Sandaracinus sp.]MCB9613246.1 AAA family ATPase [Sandaracinus sp.]
MPFPVPPSPELLQELEVLVRAHHPLIFFETVEEDRVRTVLEYLSDRTGLRLFVWNPTSGLNMLGPDGGRPVGTEKPDQALAFIEQANLEALFYLPGFPAFEGAAQVGRIKEIYRRYFRHRGQVVFASPAFELPLELEPLFTPVQLPPASPEVYHRFVSSILQEIGKQLPIRVDLSSDDVGHLLSALHGLTFFDVEKLITRAVIEDGRLDRGDLPKVLDAKRRIVERSGLLEYFPHEHRMADVAGLGTLKGWLRKRRTAFSEPARAKAFGLTPPKGLLLLGVQGCGKSLCAKAVAAEWSLPLVRLDPGNLYQKYFGESERNLRRAIQLAESLAPCVLWIDEIEKGLGRGDNDGGTSQRVFGTFLAWLQEKKESVFVIATANDISDLPPELLRKGRFDEIFFVDLPSEATRAHIFEVHLRRRGRDPKNFDLAALAEATEDFSGAEIEQAVVSALYSAFEAGGDIDTEAVLVEVRATHPLSETMREQLQKIRSWAHDRAVPAE